MLAHVCHRDGHGNGGGYSVEKAADHIMKALHRKKHVYTFDWHFRIATFIGCITPRCIWERVTWIKN